MNIKRMYKEVKNLARKMDSVYDNVHFEEKRHIFEHLEAGKKAGDKVCAEDEKCFDAYPNEYCPWIALTVLVIDDFEDDKERAEGCLNLHVEGLLRSYFSESQMKSLDKPNKVILEYPSF